MSGRARPIVLWDIDGTISNNAGAGSAAMNRTFRERFGVEAEEPVAAIDFRGASDGWIVPTVAQHHGLDWGADEQAAFVDHYCGVLAETMVERGGTLLPGVAELLVALDEREVPQGLGTGNFRRSAYVKLDYYGVGGHFLDGGFGDDSPDRPSLLAAGLERMRRHAAPEAGCVVIGDTVHDITAARAIDARVIAVETGFAEPQELADAQPDVLLTDLSDLDQALAAILAS